MGWYFSETRDEMSSLKKDGGRAALDSTAVCTCRWCYLCQAGGCSTPLESLFLNGFSSSGCGLLMDMARGLSSALRPAGGLQV